MVDRAAAARVVTLVGDQIPRPDPVALPSTICPHGACSLLKVAFLTGITSSFAGSGADAHWSSQHSDGRSAVGHPQFFRTPESTPLDCDLNEFFLVRPRASVLPQRDDRVLARNAFLIRQS
jgi:hypothetical protein